LHDEPSVVAIADQGGTAIGFAVHEPKRGRDVGERRTTLDRALDSSSPPRGIDRRVR
jgi:hypothetical protein